MSDLKFTFWTEFLTVFSLSSINIEVGTLQNDFFGKKLRNFLYHNFFHHNYISNKYLTIFVMLFRNILKSKSIIILNESRHVN